MEDKLYPLLELYYSLPDYISSPLGNLYRKLPNNIKYGDSYNYFFNLPDLDVSGSVNHISNTFFVNSLESALKIDFYKRYYSEYGVVTSQIQNLDDIKKLPVINKDHVKNNFDSFFNKESIPSGLYMTTGGSSGIPVGFYLQKGVSRAKELAFFHKFWSEYGFIKSAKTVIIRGINLRNRLYRYEPVKNSLMISSYSLTEANFPEIIKKINEFKPEFIQAYPSSIYLLVRLMNRYNINFDFVPKAIFCGSENLYSDHVTLIEKITKSVVVGWYGHAERLVLAYRNTVDGSYQFDPMYGYAETLKNENSSSESIIATGFHNSVMPLIRYDTGDLVNKSWESTAGCFAVDNIEGRKHEFVFSSKMRPVSMTAINMHDSVFDNINRFQFSQHKPGLVDFLYEPALNGKMINKKRIRGAICAKLGNDFSLNLVKSEKILLSKSGKQSFLLSSINAPL